MKPLFYGRQSKMSEMLLANTFVLVLNKTRGGISPHWCNPAISVSPQIDLAI